MAEDASPKSGRLLKVITADSEGGTIKEWSQQLPADPFEKSYVAAGLQAPPFPLEQLVFLAEQHPVHSAILEQKAADVVGTGWEWEAEDKEEKSDEEKRKELDQWLTDLAEETTSDETTHEILLSTWLDLETVGHGVIELARDATGKLVHWFAMPAHTTRFNKDGLRIAQIRGGKRRWFKRWIPGDKRVVDKFTGAISTNADEIKNPANELVVFKRPSRRSSWYGIPTYIPATGWITLSTAARDDNLFFFQNRREPRWAIILENIEDDPRIEQELRQALAVDHKEPHRNLILPLSGGGKATFQKLGDNRGDMSFERLQERSDTAILVAHRAPGERIGLVKSGALGGSTVSESSRVYKESFVQSSQSLLISRINRVVRAESNIEGANAWKWRPTELDLTEEGAVQQNAVRGFQGGIYRLDEAREKAGEEALPEDDDRGDKFFWELAPKAEPQSDGGLNPDREDGKPDQRLGDNGAANSAAATAGAAVAKMIRDHEEFLERDRAEREDEHS